MNILIDAFGGDNAPLEILKGMGIFYKLYDLCSCFIL